MVTKEGTVATYEAPAETKKFTGEQRKALEKRGYKIFCLTGQSIKSLRASGREFWSAWHKEMSDFEALVSIKSDAAVNPDKFFLPDGSIKPDMSGKYLLEQERNLSELSRQLGKKIPGVKAIIGSSADYIELACLYDEEINKDLFKTDRVAVDYARVKNPLGYYPLGVRVNKLSNGLLSISHYWPAEDVYLRVAPLIIPA